MIKKERENMIRFLKGLILIRYMHLSKVSTPILLAILIILPIFLSIIPTAESYPQLNYITFISYQGNDQAGATAFSKGQIMAYLFQVPPSVFGGAIPSNAVAYPFPGTLYDIVVNPLNTSFGFNPFMFREVRFALNYIVNRTYFINTLLGGYGIPAISPYGGEPDAIVISNVLSKYVGITYNLTYANMTIYKTLTAHGAQMINGKWFYKGKPITIYVFVRIDDQVRNQYAQYLISQLQKLGFNVETIQGDLAKAYEIVYGPDPVNSTWNIYVEAWGGVYGYYDEGLAINMYSTIVGNLPATSYYGLSWGSYNDSAYQTPDLTQSLNTIDKVANDLLNYNYTSKAQRDQLLRQLVDLGIQDAVRIFIAQSILPVFASPQLKGLLPDFAFGSLLGYQSYLAMNTPTGNATFGVRFLSRGAWNPVVGFSDAYSDQIALGTVVPLFVPIPGNGYTLPFAVKYKVVNISLSQTIPVDPNALIYNTSTHGLTYVGKGVKAKSVFIFDFSPLFTGTKWFTGQNITMADIIYQYIVAAKTSLDPKSGVYDSAANAAYSPSLTQVLGFKILNSTAIELWTSVWYFDDNYAAAFALGSFLPLGYALPGGGLFPWELYYAMQKVVADGKAVWSNTASRKTGLPWLSLVSPTHVDMIKNALNNLSITQPIPKELLQLQNLTVIKLVTRDQAVARYQADVQYINTYGNAIISAGPFKLVQYSPQTSPPFAVLARNPYFNIEPPPQILQSPYSYTVNLNIPAVVTNGSTISGTVLGTQFGTTTSQPAPNVKVLAQLVNGGNIIMTQNVTTGPNGQFTLAVPSNLPPGSYTLVLYVYSDTTALINPITYSILVTVKPATTTMTTTTTPAPPPPTTTPQTTTPPAGGLNIGIIVAIVVIIIIIIVAVLLMRRR
jgi:peptide/nickel transport system substrate-binding protein